jgi:hypothetical protein
MLHPDHDSVRSVVGRFSRGLRILAEIYRCARELWPEACAVWKTAGENSKLLEEVLVSLLVEAVEVQSSSIATVHQGPSRALIVSYYLVSHILEQRNSTV